MTVKLIVKSLYLGLYYIQDQESQLYSLQGLDWQKLISKQKTVKAKTLKIFNLVVDDVLHVGNIKTTSCNICCQEDTAEKVITFNEHKIEE